MHNIHLTCLPPNCLYCQKIVTNGSYQTGQLQTCLSYGYATTVHIYGQLAPVSHQHAYDTTLHVLFNDWPMVVWPFEALLLGHIIGSHDWL